MVRVLGQRDERRGPEDEHMGPDSAFAERRTHKCMHALFGDGKDPDSTLSVLGNHILDYTLVNRIDNLDGCA